MASYHLLYLLHYLRVPDLDVEDRTATSVAGFRCLVMGYRCYGTSWHTHLVRHDGVSLFPGLGRGWFRARCIVSVQSLPSPDLLMSLETCFRRVLPLEFISESTLLSIVSERLTLKYAGIPYLLSFFYLRHEIGVRIAVFLSAAPLATTFSGALAYGITSGHSHLANWRLLFLVEGLPTICMAPIAYFFLPDTPDTARFLTKEEKVIAKARGVRQVGAVERIGGIAWKEVGAALFDLKCWFTAFMYFSCNVSVTLTSDAISIEVVSWSHKTCSRFIASSDIYTLLGYFRSEGEADSETLQVGFSSLPVFLPTILKDMGFNAVDSQGLTAPPFFLSFLVTIFSTWVADKTQQRGYTIMVLTTVGGIGYILLATVKTVGKAPF